MNTRNFVMAITATTVFAAVDTACAGYSSLAARIRASVPSSATQTTAAVNGYGTAGDTTQSLSYYYNASIARKSSSCSRTSATSKSTSYSSSSYEVVGKKDVSCNSYDTAWTAKRNGVTDKSNLVLVDMDDVSLANNNVSTSKNNSLMAQVDSDYDKINSMYDDLMNSIAKHNEDKQSDNDAGKSQSKSSDFDTYAKNVMQKVDQKLLDSGKYTEEDLAYRNKMINLSAINKWNASKDFSFLNDFSSSSASDDSSSVSTTTTPVTTTPVTVVNKQSDNSDAQIAQGSDDAGSVDSNDALANYKNAVAKYHRTRRLSDLEAMAVAFSYLDPADRQRIAAKQAAVNKYLGDTAYERGHMDFGL